MAIKKRDTGMSNGDVVSRVSPGKFGKDYPVLWEFLTTAKYEDGQGRTLPTLTVFIDTACVKLCLNDRDQGLTGWAASETVEGAFLALERALKEDKVDWKLGITNGKHKKK